MGDLPGDWDDHEYIPPSDLTVYEEGVEPIGTLHLPDGTAIPIYPPKNPIGFGKSKS